MTYNQLTNETYDAQLLEKNIRATRIGDYINTKIKILHNFWDCDCDPVLVSPEKVKRGEGCTLCRFKRTGSTRKHNASIRYEEDLKKLKLRVTPAEPYKGALIKSLHDFWDCDCPPVLIAPSKVKQGRGCGNCFRNKKLENETYDNQLKEKNLRVTRIGDYINSATKILHNFLDCDCDPVMVSPLDVKNGRGCSNCRWERTSKTKTYTPEQYIQYLKNNNIRITPLEPYIKGNIKILHNFWDCDCDPVMISPDHAKRGDGCNKCCNKISKISNKWLSEIEENNNIILEREYKFCENRFYKADGYHKETNTIYEFYGDYWHGNSNNSRHKNEKHSEERYKETMEREVLIKKLGYNLITIWESDYIKINER